MENIRNNSCQNVAAIITAMTDAEQPFLFKTMEAVLLDPCIGQVILCVDEENNWLETTASYLIADAKLHIVRLPLMPLGGVRNRALSYVTKPWVAYCDGDDVWCEGKTATQLAIATQTGCDFVGGDHYLIDEAGKIRAFAFARHLPMPSSWVVRTEVMRQYPFNESMMRAEDGEWWMRTGNAVQKVRCHQMLLRYRVRPGSLSSPTPSKQQKTKVVAYGKIPILGQGILFFTYCVWLCTRNSQYLWLQSWGAQPTLENS